MINAIMPQPLKLVSTNIEGNRHLDKILPFLQKSKADVICLQEVYLPDFLMLKKMLGMRGVKVSHVAVFKWLKKYKDLMDQAQLTEIVETTKEKMLEGVPA